MCLLEIKGSEISIFSSGKRAAGGDTGMMSIIKRFLTEHFMIDPKSLDKANEEHVFIRVDGDLRKLNGMYQIMDMIVVN